MLILIVCKDIFLPNVQQTPLGTGAAIWFWHWVPTFSATFSNTQKAVTVECRDNIPPAVQQNPLRHRRHAMRVRQVTTHLLLFIFKYTDLLTVAECRTLTFHHTAAPPWCGRCHPD